jgi:hypothetical protein
MVAVEELAAVARVCPARAPTTALARLARDRARVVAIRIETAHDLRSTFSNAKIASRRYRARRVFIG